jgi:phage portal protein BeeE
VGHRPADKIDKDAAKLRLIALTQLQMLRRHHQRHQVVFILLQPPAGGQNR